MQGTGLVCFRQGRRADDEYLTRLEGIDEWLEILASGWKVVDGEELVALGAVAAFDGAVDVWALRGQHIHLAGPEPHCHVLCQRLGATSRAQARQIVGRYVTDDQLKQVQDIDGTIITLLP
jgi:hypothetical protein